ncbi:HU family DNA-binding protein [Seohaeicola zhoushanensis]|uniref:Integration host factor subunit beta n=1 Tax=Seohaeicola zhoushanensis TaxID=1569283 RepID=A0A8J3H1L3_9RHOB|nr:HU family DNA-binding protein [Seohaeicola zhoushanensis]GHF73277.1 integration host factor subunit beta [Seohaeicola zhoushanensis]
MIRSELIAKIADENPHLTAMEATRAITIVFDTIAGHLANDGRVELRGFGAFTTRQRDARDGRNPRTGDKVAVDAKAAIHFKTGRALHSRLNSETS